MKKLIFELLILAFFTAWALDLLLFKHETTNAILVLILIELWSFRLQEYNQRRGK